MKRFQRFRGSQKDVMDLQDNVGKVLDILTSLPILNGVLIRDVVFTEGNYLLIQHGLGRKPLGWITTKVDSPGLLYLSPFVDEPVTDLSLALVTNVGMTADLWVF